MRSTPLPSGPQVALRSRSPSRGSLLVGSEPLLPTAMLLTGWVTVLAYAATAHGGFYWEEERIVAIGLVLIAFLGTRLRRSDLLPLAFLGSVAATVILASLHAGWSWAGVRPLLSELAIGGASYRIAGMLVRHGRREDLLRVVGWTGAFVALGGVFGVAFHMTPWGNLATGEWRAASTLTYSNAFGAMMVLTVPAQALLHLRERRPQTAIPLAIGLAGIAASFSRGALLGMVVLLMTTWLLRGQARSAPVGLRQLGPVLLGASVMVAGLLPSMLGDRSQPLAVVAAMVVGGIAAARFLRPPVRILLCLCVVGLVLAAWPTSHAASAPSAAGRVASRFDVGSDTRLENWRQALRAVRRDPVLGQGPGSYRAVLRSHGQWVATGFAHNEYLQTLAETGVVGLAAFAATLLFLGWRVVRRRPEGDEVLVWALAGAACAAYGAQSFFDLMWRFPVLVSLAFVWVAVATVRPASREGGGES